MLNQQRLKEFEQHSIGLMRGKVDLIPHSPRWKRLFSDEAHLIYDQVRIESLKLYHCGSTSISGILAKPIIDIVGSMPSIEELDLKKDSLEKIGYEYKGEYGIPGRRYCVLYDQNKKTAFVHLHLFTENTKELKEHLLFRNYLRANPMTAKEYEAEKLALLNANTPRLKYSEQKTPIIQKILGDAKSWQLPQQKILCLLGSANGGSNTLSFVKESFPESNFEIVDLHKHNISPFKYDGAYSESDEFAKLANRMIMADLLAFATPVYWYAMGGSMKNFFDRFSNLLRGPHKQLGESLYGKECCLLATGSDHRLPSGFEVPFASTAIYLGMDYMGARYKSYTG